MEAAISPQRAKEQRTPRTSGESALQQLRGEAVTPRDCASPPETADDANEKEMRDALSAILGATTQFQEKVHSTVTQLEGCIAQASEARKQRKQVTSQSRRELRQRVIVLHGELKSTQKELDAERRARLERETKIGQLEERIAGLEAKIDRAAGWQVETAEELKRLGTEGLAKQERIAEENLSRIRAAKQELVSQELTAMRTSSKCVKCGAQPKQVVVLPCRHRSVCASCAEKLTVCPLCSRPIESRINVSDT